MIYKHRINQDAGLSLAHQGHFYDMYRCDSHGPNSKALLYWQKIAVTQIKPPLAAAVYYDDSAATHGRPYADYPVCGVFIPMDSIVLTPHRSSPHDDTIRDDTVWPSPLKPLWSLINDEISLQSMPSSLRAIIARNGVPHEQKPASGRPTNKKRSRSNSVHSRGLSTRDKARSHRSPSRDHDRRSLERRPKDRNRSRSSKRTNRPSAQSDRRNLSRRN